MALSFITASNANQNLYTSNAKLWKTDKGEVVEDGHPEARTLIIRKGGTLTKEEAEKHGLLNHKALDVPVPTVEVKNKMIEPESNKTKGKEEKYEENEGQHFTKK